MRAPRHGSPPPAVEVGGICPTMSSYALSYCCRILPILDRPSE
jgi:hypothetical protein